MTKRFFILLTIAVGLMAIIVTSPSSALSIMSKELLISFNNGGMDLLPDVSVINAEGNVTYTITVKGQKKDDSGNITIADLTVEHIHSRDSSKMRVHYRATGKYVYDNLDYDNNGRPCRSITTYNFNDDQSILERPANSAAMVGMYASKKKGIARFFLPTFGGGSYPKYTTRSSGCNTWPPRSGTFADIYFLTHIRIPSFGITNTEFAQSLNYYEQNANGKLTSEDLELLSGYVEATFDGKRSRGAKTFDLIDGKTPSFFKASGEEVHEGTWKATLTVSWDLGLDSPDLEAVIIPHKDYHWWMPEAGKDEKTAGNSLEVTVKVQPKNEKKASEQKAKFTFELVDVSKEPGVCMNWPRNGKDDFDLRIDDSDTELEVKNEGQSAQTKEHHKEFRISVKSYDYGAYGKLRVKAEDENGSSLSVRVEGQSSQGELMIPLDNNNNHIADKYERDFYIPGSKAADSDEDFVPEGDKNRGDGLTLFEEYRGFMTKKNKHVRSDPAKKTLFIYNKVPHAKAGIDLFSTQSRIEVFELDKETQMDPSRVINYNKHYAHKTDQHGLKMIATDLEAGTVGMTSLGPPKNVDLVKIQKDFEKFYTTSKTFTIAHELGHAVKIEHHGDGNYDCSDRSYCLSEFERMREECGYTPACSKKYRGAVNFYMAVQQGENSGDETCIMRYREANFYEKGWENKTFLPYGQDISPTQYCSVKGTNEKTGDAIRGNCMGQICVSDKY